ncbi:MAG: GTP-binding protein [Opitutales bacterium]|nr:GTP-binding protein [Opitutales bacterium]
MVPLPVLLVTGFLGSGKTTLLQRLAEVRPHARMAFLVNEFAATGVDDVLLEGRAAATHRVVGGSLFCECKAGEFIRIVCEEVLPHHSVKPFDVLVIETTGLADPESMGTLVAAHPALRALRIASRVTVVAPRQFATLLESLPVVRAQIQSADTIIINKTDLADAACLDSVSALIRAINPAAGILCARYCEVPLDWREIAGPSPAQPLSTCEANPFSTAEANFGPEVDLETLRQRLRALPPEILRVKGTLRSAGETWAINRTVDDLDIRQTTAEALGKLVLIAHDKDEALLEQACHGLTAAS